MYVVKVEYEDFSGDTRTAELCFHMPFMEIVRWDYRSTNGSYFRDIQGAVNDARIANDRYRLTEIFKDLICETYGTVIHGGGRFVRPANTRTEMMQLPELDTYLESLVLDKAVGDAFLDGVLN